MLHVLEDVWAAAHHDVRAKVREKQPSLFSSALNLSSDLGQKLVVVILEKVTFVDFSEAECEGSQRLATSAA